MQALRSLETDPTRRRSSGQRSVTRRLGSQVNGNESHAASMVAFSRLTRLSAPNIRQYELFVNLSDTLALRTRIHSIQTAFIFVEKFNTR